MAAGAWVVYNEAKLALGKKLLNLSATDSIKMAAGGSMVARFAVLYDDTAANKDLIAYCLLDSAPADVTVTTGNSLTIQINAAGVFSLT